MVEMFGDFWSSSLYNCPSHNILAKCFLARFLDDEKLHLSEMKALLLVVALALTTRLRLLQI